MSRRSKDWDRVRRQDQVARSQRMAGATEAARLALAIYGEERVEAKMFVHCSKLCQRGHMVPLGKKPAKCSNCGAGMRIGR